MGYHFYTEQVKVGSGGNLTLLRCRIKLEDILVLKVEVSENVSPSFENDSIK